MRRNYLSEVQTSDEDLIKRFHRGDQQAFSCFILRHQRRLARIAAATLYSSEQIEDAVQEVFLRSFKGLRRFRFGAEPFTWLYRCLQNVCKEFNRRTVVNRNTALSADEATEQTSDMALPLDTELKAKRIRKLVSGLPEKQREVVILRIFEEYSVKQTAEILRCRPGTVKAHLHRAITKLRGCSALTELVSEYDNE